MGYTHYWRINQEGSNTNYQSALKDIRKIVEAETEILGNGIGEGKPKLKGEICFNGLAKNGNDHETFGLEKTIEENSDFEFCKTAYKPYDIVVVACLSVLAEKLGHDVKVTSDGNTDDWTEGVTLASEVLGRDIANPI